MTDIDFYKRSLEFLHNEICNKVKSNQKHQKQIEELQNMKNKYDENQKLKLLRSIFENCTILKR